MNLIGSLIRVKALIAIVSYPVLILLCCTTLTLLWMLITEINAMEEGDKVMGQRIEVELDIFSGKPNPMWILSEEEGNFFLERLNTMPNASAKEFSNNLGYRGFIVRVMNKTKGCLIRIQNKTVMISRGNVDVYYSDQDRDLERWLLGTGKSYLKSDIFKIVKNEFQL